MSACYYDGHTHGQPLAPPSLSLSLPSLSSFSPASLDYTLSALSLSNSPFSLALFRDNLRVLNLKCMLLVVGNRAHGFSLCMLLLAVEELGCCGGTFGVQRFGYFVWSGSGCGCSFDV